MAEDSTSSSGPGAMSYVSGILGAASTLYDIYGLFKGSKKQRLYINNMFGNTYTNIQKRKNLLNRQLAARRAQMGAMGITSSSSYAAAQQRLAGEAYDDIAKEASDYNYNLDNLKAEQREKQRDVILGSALGLGSKVIL